MNHNLGTLPTTPTVAMTDQILIPRALQKGDTIAFVSPSARLNDIWAPAEARAKAYLESQGYPVKIIFKSVLEGTFPERVRQRCDELHTAFKDPEVKAIICTIGGTQINELLRHIDYDLIRANPKIFVGYSDITQLHCAILKYSRLRTFYGPTSLTDLGDYPQPLSFTTDHLFKILQYEPGKPVGPIPRSLEWGEYLPNFTVDDATLSQAEPRKLLPSPPWRWLRPGKATGRIVAGCTNSLLHIAGTKFWPDLEGAILLLETASGEKDVDPAPLSKTRAQFADLVNIGVFDQISGLVFGRMIQQDEKMENELAEILLDQASGTDFPILINLDIGHTQPLLTIPLNTLASLDSEKDEFTVLEHAVV